MNPDVKVPRFLLKLLRWLCPADLIETIEGDVIEQFHNDLIRVGIFRARLRAVFHCFDFVRLGIISRHKRKFEHKGVDNFRRTMKPERLILCQLIACER